MTGAWANGISPEISSTHPLPPSPHHTWKMQSRQLC